MRTFKDIGENHNHSILKKYESVIKALKKDRVCNISYDKDSDEFYIYEMCDEYFCHTLTKEECKEISNLFNEISENL